MNMVGYGSWDEAKQAIRGKIDEILAIGDETGVQSIGFRFDINCELLPTVTVEVTRVMYKEAKSNAYNE